MPRDNGNIYQAARKAAGLTQEAAAERLAVSVESMRAYAIHGGLDGAAKAAGMSRSTIYARIKDLPSCSGKEIAALARVTRIPVDELFALWAKAC